MGSGVELQRAGQSYPGMMAHPVGAPCHPSDRRGESKDAPDPQTQVSVQLLLIVYLLEMYSICDIYIYIATFH